MKTKMTLADTMQSFTEINELFNVAAVTGDFSHLLADVVAINQRFYPEMTQFDMFPPEGLEMYRIVTAGGMSARIQFNVLRAEMNAQHTTFTELVAEFSAEDMALVDAFFADTCEPMVEAIAAECRSANCL